MKSRKRAGGLGDLPNASPREKKHFNSAVTRVKTALREDEKSALLDDCETKEFHVAETVDVALKHTSGAALRLRLKQLANDARTRIPAFRHQFEAH